jgi:uncharacterized protein (DUF1330 family)
MIAYVAFLIDIHDQAAFTRYARAAAPTYPVYGGGVALRGPIVDVLEGDLQVSRDTRLVVLQFPSLGQAHAWWDPRTTGRWSSSASHRSPIAARSSSRA